MQISIESQFCQLVKELWSHFRYLCVFHILQNVLETLTHPHYSCPKQVIKKGLVMFHRPESKFMGWQYKNHCPISSQKSGERSSGKEKQAWLTEINNYRIKINSFRKSVKEDRTLTKSGKSGRTGNSWGESSLESCQAGNTDST